MRGKMLTDRKARVRSLGNRCYGVKEEREIEGEEVGSREGRLMGWFGR